jgi:nucleotide-binding universal stress UspA family protein
MPTMHALPATVPAARRHSPSPSDTLPTTDRPIVVATDGTASADPAFVAARLLAHRCGAPVEVVAITEPALLHLPAAFELSPVPDLDVMRMTALRDRARAQLAKVVGADTGWPVDTRYGDVAPTIQRIVEDQHAGLVVTGLSRHGILDRIYGEETNAFIIQASTVPVLAVATGTDRLPRAILVAIDSHSAAYDQSVLIDTLLSDVGAAHFVCVTPAPAETGVELSIPATPPSAAKDVEAAFERVRDSLHLPSTVRTTLETLVGNIPQELTRLARERDIDLIIVGQHRRSSVRRWFDKGLATRLLRASACSILAIPRPLHPADAERGAGTTELLTNPAEWPARFAELTHRNGGRHVSLELDDAEFGADAQVRNYPFLGIDYDHVDNRVTIMLGDPLGEAAHLTHAIGQPSDVEVLEGRDGRTLVIKIAKPRGRAWLTFVL